MVAIYELVPVIADVISAQCPGTSARERFLQACLGADWEEARSMVDGMLAEPWHLRGRQKHRLREFLDVAHAPDHAPVSLVTSGTLHRPGDGVSLPASIQQREHHSVPGGSFLDAALK